jgi:hypothetical protein
MRIVSVAFACVLSTCLGGCAFFADPNAWPQKFQYGDSENLATGPNIRYVNERPRPMPGAPALTTMCTEPSPDVAVAFGTTLAAQASVNNQGSGSLNAGTTESALELAGRTAGVLALRDGLYATCEAYSNGALGQSAYALGLSQYGNLLIALTQGQPGNAGGGSVTATFSSSSTSTKTDNSSAAPAATKASSAASPANKNKKSALDQAADPRNASTDHPVAKDKSSALDYAASHYASLGNSANFATDAVGAAVSPPANTHAARMAAADPPDKPAPAADKPAPKAAPVVNDTAQPNNNPPKQPAATKTTTTNNAAANNPQVYTATESAATALLVACISEYDPTRLGAYRVDRSGGIEPDHNQVLSLGFCRGFLEGLSKKLMSSKMR